MSTCITGRSKDEDSELDGVCFPCTCTGWSLVIWAPQAGLCA